MRLHRHIICRDRCSIFSLFFLDMGFGSCNFCRNAGWNNHTILACTGKGNTDAVKQAYFHSIPYLTCFCMNLLICVYGGMQKEPGLHVVEFVSKERRLLQHCLHIFAHICAVVRKGFPPRLNGISVGNTFATRHVQ